MESYIICIMYILYTTKYTFKIFLLFISLYKSLKKKHNLVLLLIINAININILKLIHLGDFPNRVCREMHTNNVNRANNTIRIK